MGCLLIAVGLSLLMALPLIAYAIGGGVLAGLLARFYKEEREKVESAGADDLNE